MSAPELKPCPFCGGEEYMMAGESYGTVCVCCLDCFAKGEARATKKDAIFSWNTRATSEADALRAENARLSANLEKWRGMYEREQTDNDRLCEALRRIATPKAFYVSTSNVDPEAFARMIYAEAVLGDLVLERAEQKAEFETRRRFENRAALKGDTHER